MINNNKILVIYLKKFASSTPLSTNDDLKQNTNRNMLTFTYEKSLIQDD